MTVDSVSEVPHVSSKRPTTVPSKTRTERILK